MAADPSEASPDIAFDGSQGLPGPFGDLSVGQILKKGQLNDLPRTLRQFSERLGNQHSIANGVHFRNDGSVLGHTIEASAVVSLL
jgi:hypothetical protein